ncbi:hypothetical protein C8R46DRAFT_1344233 [Mycena filopes]|nr:hypothetical protein C8R46DRAFT_1344233 [Mycena filopes]
MSLEGGRKIPRSSPMLARSQFLLLNDTCVDVLYPLSKNRPSLEHHYDPGACSSKKCTSCLSTAYQPAWENIRIGTTSTQPALDDCLVDVQSIDIPTSKKLQIASSFQVCINSGIAEGVLKASGVSHFGEQPQRSCSQLPSSPLEMNVCPSPPPVLTLFLLFLSVFKAVDTAADFAARGMMRPSDDLWVTLGLRLSDDCFSDGATDTANCTSPRGFGIAADTAADTAAHSTFSGTRLVSSLTILCSRSLVPSSVSNNLDLIALNAKQSTTESNQGKYTNWERLAANASHLHPRAVRRESIAHQGDDCVQPDSSTPGTSQNCRLPMWESYSTADLDMGPLRRGSAEKTGDL